MEGKLVSVTVTVTVYSPILLLSIKLIVISPVDASIDNDNSELARMFGLVGLVGIAEI